MEYENSELTKKNEIKKIEIEKEIIEEQMERKENSRAECEFDRQNWIKRYEEEYQSHLNTLSKLNNLKVVVEDLKAEKAKLKSDIKELDKKYKISTKISKEREKKQNKILQENEKMMIQFKGCQKALQNVEIHHKNYIKRLKKEHQKTIAERDGMYNRSTMEHEDVFMKAVKFHEENQENKSIIKTFKAHTGMYKEKYKK